ncbi:MAG TPA: SMC-Scp complex subunit ScpB [Candidatus Nanoarchaeia archaeon]|nr:SMC-Scp complex subunit ScpB [Candidatus Nanoarchaeia archaeon]
MEINTKKVEAILFAVGKEITLERISSLSSLDVKAVETILNQLKQDYDQKDNSLHLVEKESGWKLTVKDQFIPLVSSIVSSTEFEKPLMETLAIIAWKYPVVQSEVVKLRSPAAYDHMRRLMEMGFIAKEKSGRTYKLKLTSKFFNYFDLPSEEAKQAFLKQVPSEMLKEAERIDQEADEVERLIDLDHKESESKEEIKKAMHEAQE